MMRIPPPLNQRHSRTSLIDLRLPLWPTQGPSSAGRSNDREKRSPMRSTDRPDRRRPYNYRGRAGASGRALRVKYGAARALMSWMAATITANSLVVYAVECGLYTTGRTSRSAPKSWHFRGGGFGHGSACANTALWKWRAENVISTKSFATITEEVCSRRPGDQGRTFLSLLASRPDRLLCTGLRSRAWGQRIGLPSDSLFGWAGHSTDRCPRRRPVFSHSLSLPLRCTPLLPPCAASFSLSLVLKLSSG